MTTGERTRQDADVASRAALQAPLEAYLRTDVRLEAAGIGAAARAEVETVQAGPREVVAEIRAHLGLTTGPVKDLHELAHRVLGVDVFSVPGGEDGAALSARSPETGRAAVVVATTPRPLQQRLVVARELGRVLAGDVDPDREAWADAFARHLLLPVEAVSARCGAAVDLADLSALVQEFEVPPPLVAAQMREAGLLGEETWAAWSELEATHLATRFGWRDRHDSLSAASSAPRAPQALVARLVEGHRQGSVGLDELASWTGRREDDLAEESAPTSTRSEPPTESPVADLHLGSLVPTPAARSLEAHLAAGDLEAAVAVLGEHWMELWYAVDPTDLRTLLERLPEELLEASPNAVYLHTIAGRDPVARPGDTSRSAGLAGLNEAVQRVADLRLAGKAATALRHVTELEPQVRAMRGRVVGSSGGLVELWIVHGAITALLAGELDRARGHLLQATSVHRPDRFPFVRREAVAKLALTQALLMGPAEAADWLAQARHMHVTGSWVESLVDDTLWLAEYVSAVDALDLDRAEELRLARPSPLDHLEFWGIALQAHVRHLALTRRWSQAQTLCDAVAEVGLPLPDSDGWVATMLDDARLMALEAGRISRTGGDEGLTPTGVLAHRVAMLATGLYETGCVRHPVEVDEGGAELRVRLALRLLRAQSLVAAGRGVEGRALLHATLADVTGRGVHSVLRHLTTQTVAELAATESGGEVAALVRRHDLPLLVVEPSLTAPLTEAESRVLRLLAVGYSRQRIADTLVVSLSTVKSQLRTAYQKLGVRDRDEALAKLERLGLGG